MITKLKLAVASAALTLGGLSGFAFAHGTKPVDKPVDKTERKAMRDARIEKRFAMLDANKDGAVTLEEMKAAKRHGKHGRGHRRGPRKSK
jgi:hypothetical protein